MLPVFKPGEVVLVQPLLPPPSSFILSSGDCVVYSYKGRVLLHRVLKTAAGGAWFSDDAGRLEPHLVPWSDIKGRVLSRHPLAGGFAGRIYSMARRVFSKAGPRREARP